MVFISAPYSHPDPKVVKARVEEVHRECAMLVGLGRVAVSPIVIGTALLPYMESSTPTDYDYWKSFSRGLLVRSDECRVLMLPGWKDSTGVQDEIKFAKECDISITYVTYGSTSYNGDM